MRPSSSYIFDFEQWVDSFINQYGLFSKNEKLLVLVSGGADSLSLLHCLLALNYNVQPLYFHHGTRLKRDEAKDQDEHEREIQAIKKVLNNRAELIIEMLSGLHLSDSNFEHKARLMRQGILREKYHQYLWLTGHHLDDSFEWWLRGRMTQNHPDYPLGIAVKSLHYRRPFLCVSRQQIRRYAKYLGLSFHRDSSNQNDKFERNFLRQYVTSALHTRYPKYLNHYVKQSTMRAKRLGVLCDKNLRVKNEIFQHHAVGLAENLWFFKLPADLSFDESFQALLDFLKNHSMEDRGYLVKSLLHFFPKKFDRNTPLKGPMSFSGSLHLWQWGDCFFLWRTDSRPTKVLEPLDEYLKLNVSDIHFSLEKPILLLDLLGLKLQNQAKNPRSSKSQIRFFKSICPVFYGELQKRGLFVSLL